MFLCGVLHRVGTALKTFRPGNDIIRFDSLYVYAPNPKNQCFLANRYAQ